VALLTVLSGCPPLGLVAGGAAVVQPFRAGDRTADDFLMPPRLTLNRSGPAPNCAYASCGYPKVPNIALVPLNLLSAASLQLIPTLVVMTQPLNCGADADWFVHLQFATWFPHGPAPLWSSDLGAPKVGPEPTDCRSAGSPADADRAAEMSAPSPPTTTVWPAPTAAGVLGRSNRCPAGSGTGANRSVRVHVLGSTSEPERRTYELENREACELAVAAFGIASATKPTTIASPSGWSADMESDGTDWVICWRAPRDRVPGADLRLTAGGSARPFSAQFLFAEPDRVGRWTVTFDDGSTASAGAATACSPGG